MSGEPDYRPEPPGEAGARPARPIDLRAGPPSPPVGQPARPGEADEKVGEADRESATRRRILSAATEVFREKGFTGTRVIDIARRAGFTSGALYSYFDSRADLLAEAIAESSTEMLHELLGTLDVVSDPLAVLQATVDLLAEPLGENDQMLLDGVALARREPAAGERLADALNRFREQLGPDGLGLDSGQADLLVVLVLGVTAARALGLHDELSPLVKERLASCFAIVG